MHTLYTMLSISALAAALLGTLVIIYAPPAFYVSFALSIVSNYAFAFGAFGRVQVLKAAQYGRTLPVWNQASMHAIGFSIVTMIASVLIFFD